MGGSATTIQSGAINIIRKTYYVIDNFLDCCKVSKPAQERIKIIENDNEFENTNSDFIIITLQTEEGRKSRLKFLIAKVLI